MVRSLSPAPITEKERLARIALALIPGVGSTRFFKLLETFGGAAAVFGASMLELASLLGSVSDQFQDPGDWVERAIRCERETEETGGRVIVWGEPDYPWRLRRMARPPVLLFLAGSLALPNHAVGIVGRRAATGKGQGRARQMAADLAAEGVAVISGGAYGIDAAAHRGCLDAGGFTVCVLGGSLDRPYPERHYRLFSEIAESGALLSMFPPDTEPKRGYFLLRNRIIAALSDILVVVEAGSRSGARSTALHAAGMGVPVAAVPGSTGTNRLLAEGAVSVESAAEVLIAVREGRGGGPGRQAHDPMSNISLTEDGRRLLDVLARGRGRTVGFLAWQTGLSMGQLAAALVELRLAGLAEQTPGGRWALVTERIGIGQERDNGEKREHDETGSGRISGQGSYDWKVPRS